MTIRMTNQGKVWQLQALSCSLRIGMTTVWQTVWQSVGRYDNWYLVAKVEWHDKRYDKPRDCHTLWLRYDNEQLSCLSHSVWQTKGLSRLLTMAGDIVRYDNQLDCHTVLKNHIKCIFLYIINSIIIHLIILII